MGTRFIIDIPGIALIECITEKVMTGKDKQNIHAAAINAK